MDFSQYSVAELQSLASMSAALARLCVVPLQYRFLMDAEKALKAELQRRGAVVK